MSLSFSIESHQLQFIKPAKTSRNTLSDKNIYHLVLRDLKTGEQGMGEAAPLVKLSVDDIPDFEGVFQSKMEDFCNDPDLDMFSPVEFPSMRFAVETAMLDLRSESDFTLFDTPFSRFESSIPINGLVWMSGLEEMLEEAYSKIEQGFTCIKFKIGAHDFDSECRMLEKIRKDFSAFKIEIRLDANGAFDPNTALEQLDDLSRFEIHSIEQPIAPRQWYDMGRICSNSQIDIALDEELIGLSLQNEGSEMLRSINPQYIIIKPSLIGGLDISDQWIGAATKLNIGFWATSALEGNVGLNAIAQWISQYDTNMAQGLGTGSLFSNNIDLGLKVENGQMQRFPIQNSPV